MKIKSIKLTSQHEIENSVPNRTVIGASKAPVYQVEYEETTPTGLVAIGNKLLDAHTEEEVNTFFKKLEKELTEKHSKQDKGKMTSASIQGTTVTTTVNSDKYKWDKIASTNNSVDKLLDGLWGMISDAIKEDKTIDTENFMKQVNERLKRNMGMR